MQFNRSGRFCGSSYQGSSYSLLNITGSPHPPLVFSCTGSFLKKCILELNSKANCSSRCCKNTRIAYLSLIKSRNLFPNNCLPDVFFRSSLGGSDWGGFLVFFAFSICYSDTASGPRGWKILCTRKDKRMKGMKQGEVT